MIRILTVYHFPPKPEETVENRVYRPLVLPLRDPAADADPIMRENAFAEMRAHHWVQLNWESGVSHYGFQHYRRWFFPELFGRLPYDFNLAPRAALAALLATLRGFSLEEQGLLASWVEQFDIVTVAPEPTNLAAQFIEIHGAAPWRALVEVLDAMRWDGPRDDDNLRPANMFIIRQELFLRYMSFWHEVMNRIAPMLKPERGSYQERVFGFLSERLWTLWLTHERRSRPLALKEVPVLICDEWKV